MKIFALDTSAAAASCALLDGERPVGEFYTDARLTHSQTIMPMVEALLASSHESLDSVDVFAVSTGPGSFTGLRIGVAAVKGMAQVLGRPCVAVSTLEGLAWNLCDRAGLACAVLDARCGQVYTALFDLEDGVRRLWEDQAVTAEELCARLAQLDRPVTLVGDGIDLVLRTMEATQPQASRPQVPAPFLRLQHATSVALCTQAHLDRGEAPIQPGELVPAYLKLPQAQRELLAKKKSQPER